MTWLDWAVAGTLILLLSWLSVATFIVVTDWQARRDRARQEEMRRWRQMIDAYRRIAEQEGGR